MTATLPLIVLEVNLTSGGTLVLNPDAKYGLSRWTANNVTAQPNGFLFPASGAGSLTHDRIPVTPGRYLGANYTRTLVPSPGGPRRFTVKARFYNASDTAQVGAEQTIRSHIWNTDGAPIVEANAAVQVPAGAAWARVTFGADNSSAMSIITRRLAIRQSTDPVIAMRPAGEPTWAPILGSALTVDSESGVEAEGVSDELQAGFLRTVVTDPALDPATSDALRKGNDVRLRRVSGAAIWSGRIETADTNYLKDADRRTITVTATDSGRKFHDGAMANVPDGTLKEQVAAAGYAAGVVVLDQTGAVPAPSSGSVATEDGATAATWVTRATNTHGGAVWIDADGLGRVCDAADLPTEPVATLADRNDVDGLHYTELDLAYGSGDFVSDLTVKTFHFLEPQGAKVKGPFTALNSANTYGTVTDEVETIGGVAVDIATRLLGNHAVPHRFPKSATVVATEDLNKALAITPYTAVRVVREGLYDDVVRVLKVIHEIRPESWLTTYEFRRLESADPVEVAVPAKGPNSGPDDDAPSRYSIAVRSRTSAQPVANGSANAAVLKWNNEIQSEGIAYNDTTGVFTLPRTARYDLNLNVETASGNSTGTRVAWIETYAEFSQTWSKLFSTRQGGNANGNSLTINGSAQLGEGLKVRVVVAQSSGGTLNVNGSAEPDTWIAIKVADR